MKASKAACFCLGGLAVSGLLATVPAYAQLPDVAIVAAASSSLSAGQFTDPKAKLEGTGLFNSVSLYNASTGTPTLAELQQWDAVMVWSNVNFADPNALGDVLADYVDAGGGVVVTIFANTTTTTARIIGGRWKTDGYEVIPSAGGTTSSTGGAQSLGNILVPGHPILDGVNSFNGGTTSWRPTTTALVPGATKVAEWTDGKTLVAVGPKAGRADLGMYPPSGDFVSGWWVSSTDGARLMANALLFTMQKPGCKGDIDGDGKTCQSDLGVLLAVYGLCEGDPGYNPKANLAASTTCPTNPSQQVIDQADLGVLLADYGCGGCP